MTTRDARTFSELADRFTTGMLITHGPTGELKGRPMTVARVDEDGTMWFVTSRDSDLVDELLGTERAAVSLQSTTLYLHAYGRTRVFLDEPHAREAWNPTMKAWFPEGVESSDLAVVQLEPTSADWWDIRGGRTLRFAFELARSLVSGEPMPSNEEGVRGHADL